MSDDRIPPKPERVYPATAEGQIQHLSARLDRFAESVNTNNAGFNQRLVQIADHSAGLGQQLVDNVNRVGAEITAAVGGRLDLAETYGRQQYEAILDRLRLLEDDSACHKLVNRLAARVAELESRLESEIAEQDEARVQLEGRLTLGTQAPIVTAPNVIQPHWYEPASIEDQRMLADMLLNRHVTAAVTTDTDALLDRIQDAAVLLRRAHAILAPHTPLQMEIRSWLASVAVRQSGKDSTR